MSDSINDTDLIKEGHIEPEDSLAAEQGLGDMPAPNEQTQQLALAGAGVTGAVLEDGQGIVRLFLYAEQGQPPTHAIHIAEGLAYEIGQMLSGISARTALVSGEYRRKNKRKVERQARKARNGIILLRPEVSPELN